jgi:ribosomal protein S25
MSVNMSIAACILRHYEEGNELIFCVGIYVLNPTDS